MRNIRLLPVDDEEEFVETLADRLRMRALGADTVHNGEQALSFVKDNEPDVMLLDIKMPGIAEKRGRRMPDKIKMGFIIDALMFLYMMIILGLGLLMKFILIPGKERWVKYGRSVELSLLGMDRHEWGTIHLTIGFVLLGLLALHVILHWKIIVGLFQKLVGNQKARRIIAPTFVLASLLLLLVPFALKPDIHEMERGRSRQSGANSAAYEKCPEIITHDTGYRADDLMESRGFMTLAEVSEKHNVPTQCLKTHLGIPVSVPDMEKLGRLKKNYNFTMSDVEGVIAMYRGDH